MRQDNGSLLSRIDQGSFNYLEFEDTTADGDAWPIFEALLRDERVVGSREARIRRTQTVGIVRANGHATPPGANGRGHDGAKGDLGAVDGTANLFNIYSGEPAVAASRPAAPSSVKILLERLARPA